MRSRNFKPGLFLNEILGQEDPMLTLVFLALQALADRDGLLEDRPVRIRAEAFPYRGSLDIHRYLTVLSRYGFIQRFVNSGVGVIKIVNFAKHQTPHHTERKSMLPHLEDDGSALIGESKDGCELTVNSPLSNGGNPPDSLNHDSSTTPISPLKPEPLPDLELQPEPTPTRKGKRKANPYTQQTIAPENRDAFERAWKQWPEKHPEGGDAHKGSKAQAERNFQAIVDSGECTRRELSVAMTLYAKADTFREEQDPLYPLILDAWSHRASYVKHVASFLGPQDLIYRQFLPLARVALAEADAKRLQPRNDQHQAAS